MAAHQSAEHAGLAAAGAVLPDTISHLTDEVGRLATEYMNTPPTLGHTELIQARNVTYRLLDTTKRPNQLKDLYSIAGQLPALLTCATFDLGQRAAAWEHSRAAWAYAEIIDHPELRAWTRGMQASMAYWNHRPRQAIDLAQSALDYATGTGRARLLSMQARAHSQLGDARAIREALSQATDARQDAGNAEIHDLIGGALGFEEPKQAGYGCAAYRYITDSESAIREGQRALRLYQNGPRDQRWIRVEAVARIDLAAAFTSQGDLDGAQETLGPVLDLSPDQRTSTITQKLEEFAGELGGQRKARELGAVIENYALEAAM